MLLNVDKYFIGFGRFCKVMNSIVYDDGKLSPFVNIELIDKIKILMVILDRSGKILSVNKYLCELTGYDYDELIGENWFKIFTPWLSEDLAASFIQSTLTEQPLNQNNLSDSVSKRKTDYLIGPILTKAGNKILIEWKDSVVQESDGKITGICIIGKDITKYYSAKDALRKIERRFKIICENVPGIVYVKRVSDDKILYLNDRVEEITGYSKEDFIENKIDSFDIIDPNEVDSIRSEFERKIEACEDFSFTFKFRHKDGELKWVHSRGTVFVEGDDKYIEGFIYDISDLREIEQALKDSELKFRTLTENSAVGVYIIDNFKYIYVNPALVKMYKYNSPDEMINKITLRDIVHPSDYHKVVDVIEKRLSNEVTIINYEHLGITKNREIITVEIHGSTMHLNGKTVVIGTVIDITDRKRIEQIIESRRQSASRLISATDFPQILEFVLDMTSDIAGITCGCIYLLEEDKLKLVANSGLNDSTVNSIQEFDNSSKWYQLVMNDTLFYRTYSQLISDTECNISPILNNEGLKSVIVLPMKNNQGNLVAFLVLGSRTYEKFDNFIKASLEAISGQVGEMILRIKTEEVLKTSLENLRKALDEKDVLIREIHHRVKNNFQVVSSLLGLYIRKINNDEAKSAIRDIKDRIYTMSLIHEKLYKVGNLSCVNLEDYINDLILTLMTSYHISKSDITINKSIHCKQLDLTKAVPIGIIINEVILNIFKHAFTADMINDVNIVKQINIYFGLSQHEADKVELVISDNGVGLPSNFHDNGNSKKSFGIYLIEVLSKSLNGTYEFVSNNGTTFKFLIPREEVICNDGREKV